MIAYLTAAEIALLYARPPGTIRRLASNDRWRRTTDGKRPVLYLADDVETTMRRITARLLDTVTCGEP